jgi:hypothetical protein
VDKRAELCEKFIPLQRTGDDKAWPVAECPHRVWEKFHVLRTHNYRNTPRNRIMLDPAQERPGHGIDLHAMHHNNHGWISERWAQIIRPGFDLHAVTMLTQDSTNRVDKRGGAANEKHA